MIIRKLKEEDRNTYRKLMRYAFSTNINSYEKMEWPKDSVPIENIYGAFENEEMVAGSAILPIPTKIRGKVFKMWGIAGVATKPEHRNNRAIRKIFDKKFQDMKEAEVAVSVLYPFKFFFYEQLGYYLADESVFYQFKISDIKKVKTPYTMREVYEITDDIKGVYEKASEKFDYIAKREKICWKRKTNLNYKFVCYNNNKPVGYILLHFPNMNSEVLIKLEDRSKSMYVEEMFYLDSTAKQTMYNFLRSHRDQFQFCAGTFPKQENIIDILETPRIMYRTIVPNSQLRIIDVKTVLETINYPINNFSLKIRIRDEQCPWNNGDFHLTSENGIIKVVFEEKTTSSVDLESDIGHFSQLLAGFRTVNHLLEFNFIKINTEKRELLQMLFPLTNNYFREFF